MNSFAKTTGDQLKIITSLGTEIELDKEMSMKWNIKQFWKINIMQMLHTPKPKHDIKMHAKTNKCTTNVVSKIDNTNEKKMKS